MDAHGGGFIFTLRVHASFRACSQLIHVPAFCFSSLCVLFLVSSDLFLLVFWVLQVQNEVLTVIDSGYDAVPIKQIKLQLSFGVALCGRVFSFEVGLIGANLI